MKVQNILAACLLLVGSALGSFIQEPPKLMSATVKNQKTIVKGQIENAQKNTVLIVQIFNNEQNRYPITEGAYLLGQLTVKADSKGNASVGARFPCTAVGSFVSATATSEDRGTSEMSASIVVR